MNGLVKLAISTIAGLGLGVFSAQALIDGYGGFFSVSHGPWTSWPTAGTRSSNPYVRAHYLVHNRLPISQFEINELEARTDDEGDLLDANCTYVVKGLMPKTRWWSLYTFSQQSGERAALPKRAGIGSQQVFYQPDGNFSIKLSNEPQTGNWLIPARGDELVLVLRHYNPSRSITSQFSFENLPTITKGQCR